MHGQSKEQVRNALVADQHVGGGLAQTELEERNNRHQISWYDQRGNCIYSYHDVDIPMGDIRRLLSFSNPRASGVVAVLHAAVVSSATRTHAL